MFVESSGCAGLGGGGGHCGAVLTYRSRGRVMVSKDFERRYL
jgi:hypothetical protein